MNDVTNCFDEDEYTFPVNAQPEKPLKATDNQWFDEYSLPNPNDNFQRRTSRNQIKAIPMHSSTRIKPITFPASSVESNKVTGR